MQAAKLGGDWKLDFLPFEAAETIVVTNDYEDTIVTGNATVLCIPAVKSKSGGAATFNYRLMAM
jgi:hypothetical protein